MPWMLLNMAPRPARPNVSKHAAGRVSKRRKPRRNRRKR